MVKQPSKKEHQKEILKNIVLALHAGGDLTVQKATFKRELGNLDPVEITSMKQSSIRESKLIVVQIMKLCNLHGGVFHEALEHQQKPKQFLGI